MKRSKLPIFYFLLFLCLVIAVAQREVLTLEAKGNIKAYKNPMWSYVEPPDQVIPKGALLPVVGCEDIKTDIHIKVEKDGIIYNISDGSFVVIREDVSLLQRFINQRATFSCRGLFLNEQKAIGPGNA